MSRRTLLSAVAALAVTPAVVAATPAATTDAELIRECDAAVAAFKAGISPALTYPLTFTFAEAKPYDDEADRLLAISATHEERAVMMPALTRAGLAAKARMLVACAVRKPDGTIDPDCGCDLAWALVQEVMHLEGVA